jgi:hypothetical protein
MPAAAKIDEEPASKKPSKCASCTSSAPSKTNHARQSMRVTTIAVWMPPVRRAPSTLRTPNTIASVTARRITGGLGQSRARYAPMPTRANATLSTSASHVPKPPIVPKTGPRLRSRK